VSIVFVAQSEGAWIQRTNAYSETGYSSTFRCTNYVFRKLLLKFDHDS